MVLQLLQTLSRVTQDFLRQLVPMGPLRLQVLAQPGDLRLQLR